jgi:hypothetical protein
MGFIPSYGYPIQDPNVGIPAAYGTSLPRQRLFVVVNKNVSQEQLGKLFGRFPGMEYCDLKRNKKTGESKGFAYVNYSTIQAAQMVRCLLVMELSYKGITGQRTTRWDRFSCWIHT